ncbi:hypothetical protein GF343_05820 [Candidatus Woesearchaeota archaeon]|nr:hypothetical protein [Candidatus Woesearchaeota archaeon]
MNREQRRLAFIILDVVAIIAILGIVLLDDISRGYEKSEFQKLLTGKAHFDEGTACDAVKCRTITEPAQFLGKDQKGYSICKCPDRMLYSITSFYSQPPETDINQP